MLVQTPFGPLHPSEGTDKSRVDAVLRALNWCEQIVSGTLWTTKAVGERISLRQTINGQMLEMFPLEAAFLDLGQRSLFTSKHLPIHLNGFNACVRFNRNTIPKPLHTDMVASMILLLGQDSFEPAHIPDTLYEILTSEQFQSLPPVPTIAPLLQNPRERGTFTVSDAEARDFFTTAPQEHWLHHAKRLCPRLQPNTLRWILFHLIEDEMLPSTWASEQLYSNPDLYSMVHIENALSHPSITLRSWAIMHFESHHQPTLLSALLPMRFDDNALIINRVFTRIRGLSLSEEEKYGYISPLLDSETHRGIALVHIGHLSLPAERKLEILGPFLESLDANYVISSIRGLRDSGCNKTEQRLIQCITHESEFVQRCLLQCIASFGPWFEPYAVKMCTVKTLQPHLLKALGRARGFDQVPLIKSIIQKERNTIIVRGLSALSKIHSVQAIELIGSYLLTHESRYVRRNAAEYLGETGRISALTYLHKAGVDISNGVRDSALRSIKKISGPKGKSSK